MRPLSVESGVLEKDHKSVYSCATLLLYQKQLLLLILSSSIINFRFLMGVARCRQEVHQSKTRDDKNKVLTTL